MVVPAADGEHTDKLHHPTRTDETTFEVEELIGVRGTDAGLPC